MPQMIKSSIIENKYLRIKTINLGATLVEVYDKKKKTNLILNLGVLSNYKNNKSYLGSTCGRFANRIKNAQFKIGNKTFKLSRNEGRNLLHGGKVGFDSLYWNLVKKTNQLISYELYSKDGDQGFPGNLKVLCNYRLVKNALTIELTGVSDQSTHINLVNHAYWNLDLKKNTIHDHELVIKASSYLENDKENIPTGKKVRVTNTPFDFTKWQIIGAQLTKNDKGFDENFILQGNLAAKLLSKKSNIMLSIFTNQPGIQFYTGQFLKFKSKQKTLYPYQGLCLETQNFPNSPNEISFPSSLLKKNKIYKHITKYEVTHI